MHTPANLRKSPTLRVGSHNQCAPWSEDGVNAAHETLKDRACIWAHWHALVVSCQVVIYREEEGVDDRDDVGTDSFEQHARLTQRLTQLIVPEAPYGLGLKVLRDFPKCSSTRFWLLMWKL